MFLLLLGNNHVLSGVQLLVSSQVHGLGQQRNHVSVERVELSALLLGWRVCSIIGMNDSRVKGLPVWVLEVVLLRLEGEKSKTSVWGHVGKD